MQLQLKIRCKTHILKGQCTRKGGRLWAEDIFPDRTSGCRSRTRTEFYLLLQHGLDKAGVFHLPALYASFRAPARRIYADEAAGCLTLSETADEGAVLLSAPRNLQLLYSSLHVEPDGSPAALLLTEECSRAVCAVQLLPPFVWEDPLPPLPDVPAALTLQLTLQDVEAIDTDPAALARRLCQTTRQKHWLAHPKADLYLAEKIALFQRLYR